jgi:hypothetical protein
VVNQASTNNVYIKADRFVNTFANWEQRLNQRSGGGQWPLASSPALYLETVATSVFVDF